jgi:hypothetical protein
MTDQLDGDWLPLHDGREIPPDSIEDFPSGCRLVTHTSPDGRRWETLSSPLSSAPDAHATALFLVEDDGTRKWAGCSIHDLASNLPPQNN